MSKISDLKAWEKNPRKITPAQSRILAKTLQEFGDLSGIVNNVALQRLVTAHQRVKQINGSTEIVIEKRYPSPTRTGTVAEGYIEDMGERFRYREVSWPEEARHAQAALAANEAGGEWNFAGLKDVLLELDISNLDMELSGFELSSIENLLVGIADSVEGRVEQVNRGDENSEWAKDMPEFVEGDDYIKLSYIFASEDSRAKFVAENDVTVDKKLKTTWIVYVK